MRRFAILFTLLFLNVCRVLFGQGAVQAPGVPTATANGPAFIAAKAGASTNQRYYRLICLVHLTGSGKANDPILPEYVAAGTAIAQASMMAATAASSNPASTSPKIAAPAPMTDAPTPPGVLPPVTKQPPPGAQPAPAPVSAATPPVARPGFLSWSMQKSDDGTMAIVHIVAADPAAFAPILADTRPEIRVFQIGKDSPAAIQAEMKKYKQDFDLESFEVRAQ